MLNITLRKKAKQFSRLVRHSAMTRRTGQSYAPVLAQKGELALTFIGHSSFFAQIGGKNVVFDPNFARWLVVLKRLRNPGLHVRDLPPIDYVVVSHAHFDHLNRPSLRAISRVTWRQSGRTPEIIVPHNVGDLVSGLGYRRIHELRWWESFEDDALRFTHVPARHWGARMLKDYHRGYGGFVVRSEAHSVYHAGDTAYFEGFAEIGERMKPEVALLPIGAYDPPSFRNVHTSPEDAVQAFLDMKTARWLVPMHYGTFRLSHEPMDEPLKRLRSAAHAANIADKMAVLKEGVTRLF